ncbi:TetR/AcrR family transcriptional regulator [Microbacterium sp. LMI12-1-1.1]|uniref:TetR/AcrR family transcriptional regulator n=1 Tax=Microbacterium sp. LMI12-1-1.1 TaxID=3135225 RepID=UPI00342DC120
MAEKRGPKRSETARSAILRATVDELSAKGYESLSIEGIAALAGVGKRTIYRWWPSKGAILAECLVEGMIPSPSYPPAESGDVRADVSQWLAEAMTIIDAPENRAMFTGLVGASCDNPDVARALTERVGSASALAHRLTVGRDAGQLPADQPVEPLVSALIGTLIVRILSPAVGPAGSASDVVRALLPRPAVEAS